MSRRRRYKHLRKRRHNAFRIVQTVLFLALLFIGIITLFNKYQEERFLKNTFIYDVNCSKLTVDEAFEKINEHLKNHKITYLFVDDSFSSETLDIDITLDNTVELEKFLEEQNTGNENYEYTLSSFNVNEAKLKDYILTFPCFKVENIKKAQNAYLALSKDNRFYIEPEVIGNELDFEEAYQLALSTLKSGSTTVDFREITKTNPDILSTNSELIAKRDSLNAILDTIINYTLPDGSIFTLDSNIIKNWISQNEEGIYQINVESNLTTFVDELAKKVTNTNSTVVFNATDSKGIEISVPWSRRASLNRENEIAQIKNELGTQVNRSPIYKNSVFSFSNYTSYVEIDTTRQNVWMYIDGVCIVNTPCVTGNYSNHHTPSGIFSLTYKTKDTYLKGNNDDGTRYSSHVDYWMPFNGGIGMHDATWRNKFGGTIYKGNGSHGCVNLPLKAAATIYENITSQMLIVVYES